MPAGIAYFDTRDSARTELCEVAQSRIFGSDCPALFLNASHIHRDDGGLAFVGGPHAVQSASQEVAAMIPSPLLHLGGDEPDLRCWEEHEERENETGYPEPLESFQRVLDGVLEDAHIPPSRVIRWGDVGNTSTTPRANIVQAWRDRGHRLLERGHELIVSWGWYYNQASNDCLTWMDCYQNSPHTAHAEDQWPRILGGEGCAWELSSEEFKKLVWGKLVATAERLWSDPDICQEDEVRGRLQRTLEHLRAGVQWVGAPTWSLPIGDMPCLAGRDPSSSAMAELA
ncbi:hypothetical protein CYMTET_26945 [Cymbomonas tetramitiformis]|uniref:beta-N-acetylhexosaminidase n=1 Tax=Cymbomonas tetramitiformis TaxID=36881 RepID=A0AAE0KXM8_9CHLO|nr:hypothetical protein CYMTET_26945 [Cymbomonas tetramitiformis]